MVMKEKMSDGSIRLISGVNIAEIADLIMNYLLASNPVGSIKLTTNNVNPSTYLTGTTWVAWGAGRVPVGLNAADASFDTSEETGGAKTHTHGLDNSSTGARIRLAADNGVWATTKTMPSRAATRTVTVSANASTGSGTTVGIAIEGDSDAASSLPPYIVCYMWKRTA